MVGEEHQMRNVVLPNLVNENREPLTTIPWTAQAIIKSWKLTLMCYERQFLVKNDNLVPKKTYGSWVLGHGKLIVKWVVLQQD